MAEYINKTKIPWVKTDNPKGNYWDRIVCESTIENMEPADVIERSKIDKALKEMDDLAAHKVIPISFDQSVAIDMCIGILKRNLRE